MPEIHLRQKITYSACGLFTKNKERIFTFLLCAIDNYS